MTGLLRHLRYLAGMSTSRRRARARFIVEYLISEGWDEVAYRRRWPDWAYAPSWGVLDRVGALTCRVRGHDPAVDHCGMPGHDYCQVCQALTPGQAHRTPAA